ncbi:MAG: type II toxin-antitoxin system RelE/ParE family toxin [Acidobacteriota bacterium]|nr:type II toxin-antitoxin system RelE/ParE family toxin [Acidobacteriota bacterium]
MTYPVRITRAAMRDLEEIYDWIAEHDSLERADYVLDRLSETAEGIASFPDRGWRPHELPPGMKANCRQVLFKPYRLIYQVLQTEVVIHLIADGRRNLQSLLLRRLARD